MNLKKTEMREDTSRDLFWTQIIFSSDDGSRESRVLVAASREYFAQSYELSTGGDLTSDVFNTWLDSVISKWLKLGDEVLNKSTHYDVYATTESGEANGLDFLLSKFS